MSRSIWPPIRSTLIQDKGPAFSHCPWLGECLTTLLKSTHHWVGLAVFINTTLRPLKKQSFLTLSVSSKLINKKGQIKANKDQGRKEDQMSKKEENKRKKEKERKISRGMKRTTWWQTHLAPPLGRNWMTTHLLHLSWKSKVKLNYY